jgi:hypothetical protein
MTQPLSKSLNTIRRALSTGIPTYQEDQRYKLFHGMLLSLKKDHEPCPTIIFNSRDSPFIKTAQP